MNKIDKEPFVIDIMDDIMAERKRLEGMVASHDFQKNLRNWGWMKDWLEKPDEEHYKTWFHGECNVCGRKARFFLGMSFSFCDEYGCGMRICSKCLVKIQRIFKEGVKGRSRKHEKT